MKQEKGLKPIKEKVEKEKKKFKVDKKNNIYSISDIVHYILILILGVVLSFFIYKYKNVKNELTDIIDNQKIEISQLKRENQNLIESNSKNLNKLDFYDKHIVFVIEGYGNYYYSYDCMKKKTGNSSYTYWAYNLEQAISRGYSKGNC